MILSGVLKQYYEIDPKNSWMIAAAEKNLPIIVPGWEDSTMGNIFASYCIKGDLKASTMKSGIEYMVYLTEWYKNNSKGKGAGFFQIGGGIAGISRFVGAYDVPGSWGMIRLQLFRQISDSNCYGSYSGAVPNEK